MNNLKLMKYIPIYISITFKIYMNKNMMFVPWPKINLKTKTNKLIIEQIKNRLKMISKINIKMYLQDI